MTPTWFFSFGKTKSQNTEPWHIFGTKNNLKSHFGQFISLAAKVRNLRLFKMAFQVVFSAKNVQRFSFGLSFAPKLKKEGGAIMAPPRVTTSFQSTGKIGLIE